MIAKEDLHTAASTIRHVFFDLDGTIIKKDRSVSIETKNCIKKLQSAGLTVSAATGRPLFSVKNLLEDLGCNGASVTFSGALITEDKSFKGLNRFSFKQKQLAEIIKFLNSINCTYEVYDQDNYFITSANELTESHANLLAKAPIVLPENEIISMGDRVIKVEAVMHIKVREKLVPIISSGLPEYSCDFASAVATPELYYCNITAVKDIRQKAFKQACECLHLRADEIIAIGDSDSDLAFVENAGIGIAMGNGSTKIKSAAKLITSDVEAEGFLKAFECLKMI